MDTKVLSNRIIELVEEKKAKNVCAIDISNISILTDCFIVCSGTSRVHIQAIADDLEDKLKKEGIPLLRKEGYNSARWILMDYGNVVVHIFHEEERNFYNLERLWSDGLKTTKEITT